MYAYKVGVVLFYIMMWLFIPGYVLYWWNLDHVVVMHVAVVVWLFIMVAFLFDKLVMWHERKIPWKGLMNR